MMAGSAGRVHYDRFGSSTVAFHSAVLVAFVATLMVRAIRARPVSRRTSAMVVAVSTPGA